MAQFILTYHGGGRPSSPEEGKAHMEKYMAWIGGLNASVPQQPLKKTETLGAPVDGHVPMMGYSIIEADDMDAALEIANACPFLEMDISTMQVSELMVMGS
jgi:hypothetical protein